MRTLPVMSPTATPEPAPVSDHIRCEERNAAGFRCWRCFGHLAEGPCFFGPPKPKADLRIKLTPRSTDVLAEVEGTAGRTWAAGRSGLEALGSLLSVHAELFGVAEIIAPPQDV